MRCAAAGSRQEQATPSTAAGLRCRRQGRQTFARRSAAPAGAGHHRARIRRPHADALGAGYPLAAPPGQQTYPVEVTDLLPTPLVLAPSCVVRRSSSHDPRSSSQTIFHRRAVPVIIPFKGDPDEKDSCGRQVRRQSRQRLSHRRQLIASQRSNVMKKSVSIKSGIKSGSGYLIAGT